MSSSSPSSSILSCNRFSHSHIDSASPSSSLLKVNNNLPFLKKKRFRVSRLCIVNNSTAKPTDYESSDFESSPTDSKGNSDNHERRSLKTNGTLEKLRRYGLSGVLAYGLLNTAYYLTTFLVVWFYVAPAAPGRIGYLAAVERFVKVMAMVWAGSQVTKIIRAGGALALAPLVDRGLSWFTVRYKFESQGKAFMVIAGFCFGLAFLLFLILTLLSA